MSIRRMTVEATIDAREEGYQVTQEQAAKMVINAAQIVARIGLIMGKISSVIQDDDAELADAIKEEAERICMDIIRPLYQMDESFKDQIIADSKLIAYQIFAANKESGERHETYS